RVLREGSTARHMPIRHQSGRSDISSDRGHTSPGSYPSTMEAPPSNQDGLHRIQVIQRTQEVFGRTLRVEHVLDQVDFYQRHCRASFCSPRPSEDSDNMHVVADQGFQDTMI